ncbi:MAG: hypothetical protein J5680_07590 [Neisseriaceae bacterium]|nr:hypothetical protein [Neisseriaceae bacterium]MBR5676238.1 hypothetical protein [Neisseriaceae bacterium]
MYNCNYSNKNQTINQKPRGQQVAHPTLAHVNPIQTNNERVEILQNYLTE